MPHRTSEKIACSNCLNQYCLVKKNFSAEQLNHWESEKNINYYKKGDPIFSIGDPIIGMDIVLKGIVELFLNNHNDKNPIIRFATDGDVFGHVSLENETYPSSSIAKDDTAICFFKNKTLLEMHQSNPKFAFDLITFYSRNHNKTVTRLLQSQRMSIREKVADAILFLYHQFGVDENKELKECFNRDDISRLVNITTEQVSRQITDFEKEKMIEKRSRRIAILDINKLKKITRFYYTELKY